VTRWRGWSVLAVSSIALIATSPGQTYIVSLFNLPMRRELGLSATELSAAYTAATLASASLLSWIGKRSDRTGPGRLMAVAAVGLALATLWMGQVTSLPMLVLGFFGVRLCGQGALSLGSGHALAMWFERRLGFAEGIRLTAYGVGMATIPAAVAWAIASLGWRAAWPVVGAVAAASVGLALLLLHQDRPEDVGQTLDGDPPHEDGVEAPVTGLTLPEARRLSAFWAVALSSCNNALIATALLFHVQPLGVRGGFAEAEAAKLIGVFAISSTCLFFAAGALSDRVRPGRMFAAVATLLAVACVLHAWPTPPRLYVAWTLLGAALALQRTTSAPTLARCFGRAHHGAIRGLVGTIAVAGTAVGPLVLGLSDDATGSFQAGLLGCAAVSLAVGAFALMARIEPVA